MKKIGIFLLAAATALSVQARAPGERTAWQAVECDHACLSQWTRDYVSALARRDASSLKQHDDLRFTENNVELPFGTVCIPHAPPVVVFLDDFHRHAGLEVEPVNRVVQSRTDTQIDLA